MTGSPTEHRAAFDATVTFANGGSLSVEGFRVDVPGPDVDEDTVGRLFVASLGLLMTKDVTLSNLTVFPEAHKGTRGGPSDRPSWSGSTRRWVELSHVLHDGLVTYPGLPALQVRPHLTREDSRAHYGPGTEFAIDHVSMVGNTGTYLDSPWHRHADGSDLSEVQLERLLDLPATVVRVVGSGGRAVDVGHLAAVPVEGAAVLLHTGGDVAFGTPAYAADAPFLTASGARHLVERGAALVGIDAVNIDDVEDLTRPAHTVLLAAGIPVVEHLTNLAALPPTGARFTALPPRLRGVGTFTVRAVAAVPVDDPG